MCASAQKKGPGRSLGTVPGATVCQGSLASRKEEERGAMPSGAVTNLSDLMLCVVTEHEREAPRTTNVRILRSDHSGAPPQSARQARAIRLRAVCARASRAVSTRSISRGIANACAIVTRSVSTNSSSARNTTRNSRLAIYAALSSCGMGWPSEPSGGDNSTNDSASMVPPRGSAVSPERILYIPGSDIPLACAKADIWAPFSALRRLFRSDRVNMGRNLSY